MINTKRLNIQPGRKITLLLQYRRCGRASCVCSKKHGKKHGPYWYAYYHDQGGRLRSRYLGRADADGTNRPDVSALYPAGHVVAERWS